MGIWYNTSAQPTKGADSLYCITWHRQKRIIYSGLCLLLLIGLLLHAFTFPQEQEVWGEDLVPWLRGRKTCRRASGHSLAIRLHCLAQRGRVVLLRLSVMAVLLLWSGWAERQRLS